MNNDVLSAVVDILSFVYFIALFLAVAYNLMKGSVIKSVIANEIEKKGVDHYTSVYSSYSESETVRILGDKKEVRYLYGLSFKYIRRGICLMLLFGLSITLY